MLVLAQTTLPAVPESWIDLLVKLTALIVAISGLLLAISARTKAGEAKGDAKQAQDLGVQALTHAATAQGRSEAQAASITRLSDRSNVQDQNILAAALKVDPNATSPPPLPTTQTPPDPSSPGGRVYT